MSVAKLTRVFCCKSISLAFSCVKFTIDMILWYFEFFLKPSSSPETPTSSMAPPSSTPSYAPQSVSTQSSTADTLSESTINLKRELEVSSSSFFVFFSVCYIWFSFNQRSIMNKCRKETIMELVKTLLIKNLANQIMCLQRHIFLYPPAERDMWLWGRECRA